MAGERLVKSCSHMQEVINKKKTEKDKMKNVSIFVLFLIVIKYKNIQFVILIIFKCIIQWH